MIWWGIAWWRWVLWGLWAFLCSLIVTFGVRELVPPHHWLDRLLGSGTFWGVLCALVWWHKRR